MKLNVTYKIDRNNGNPTLSVRGVDEPISVKTKIYSYQSFRGPRRGEMFYLDMADDGFLPLAGGFVEFSMPSRVGSVGRVIGIKGDRVYQHSHYNGEEIYNEFKVVVRFDEEDKELGFDEYQLSDSKATETNYQYHQTKGVKYESIESNYGQPIAVDDYVVGIKTRSLYFGRVIKINPKSVRVEPFKVKGNGYAVNYVTLSIYDLLKIERDVDIESQVALMMLTSL